MRLGAIVLLLACAPPPDASRQLDQCRVASRTAHELTTCLTLTHNWRADSAILAAAAFQLHLDSVKALCERLSDSLYRAQFGPSTTPEARHADSVVMADARRAAC